MDEKIIVRDSKFIYGNAQNAVDYASVCLDNIFNDLEENIEGLDIKITSIKPQVRSYQLKDDRIFQEAIVTFKIKGNDVSSVPTIITV